MRKNDFCWWNMNPYNYLDLGLLLWSVVKKCTCTYNKRRTNCSFSCVYDYTSHFSNRNIRILLAFSYFFLFVMFFCVLLSSFFDVFHFPGTTSLSTTSTMSILFCLSKNMSYLNQKKIRITMQLEDFFWYSSNKWVSVTNYYQFIDKASLRIHLSTAFIIFYLFIIK